MGLIEVTVQGLEKLQKFSGWQKTLDEWLVIAMTLSLVDVQQVAKRNAYESFEHPLGGLESHFLRPIYSYHMPVEGAVTNDSPYAWRRERGFSGMTDSLGRYFTNDPGKFYMENTLNSEKDWVKKKFQWAVNKALAELTQGGLP